MIAVYPLGMNDTGPIAKRSWNTPHRPFDTSICTPYSEPQSTCSFSCAKLKQCYTCSWCTCYDDIAFAKKLVLYLKEELCLDDA